MIWDLPACFPFLLNDWRAVDGYDRSHSIGDSNIRFPQERMMQTSLMDPGLMGNAVFCNEMADVEVVN
jgi:hypothetical protein